MAVIAGAIHMYALNHVSVSAAHITIDVHANIFFLLPC